jgi:hypothetical protein
VALFEPADGRARRGIIRDMNWFLNSGTKPAFPNAPPSAVTFQGNGSNIVNLDWENDLLGVVRWIRQNAFNERIGPVLGSLAGMAR